MSQEMKELLEFLQVFKRRFLAEELTLECLRHFERNSAAYAHNPGSPVGAETAFSTRWSKYAELNEAYGETAVQNRLEELIDLGYAECGVSVRTGWLEPKGQKLLQELLDED
jgi:hypothetical protein